MTRRLIIAPHVDDDVIGCGGIMRKGDHVYYIGVDDFHVVSASDRIREAERVAEYIGLTLHGPDGYAVNSYRVGFPGIVRSLEHLINANRFDEVLLPWPSYNQDHQTVYDAAMVALRPHDTNHFVQNVLLYEEPDCFWPGIRQPFVPNVFREIDIEQKITLYQMMSSQVRGHRSPDHIRALAAVRGAAIMRPYAEAFHAIRIVDWNHVFPWPVTGDKR